MLDFMKEFKEPTTIPYGLWVDDSGLARRLRYTAGSEGEVSVTIEFSDFGVPVVLHTPPADQVMSASEFMDLAMKQSSCESETAKTDAGEGGIVMCGFAELETRKK